MKIKTLGLLILSLLILAPIYSIDKLNMFISTTRFLDQTGDTILNIDYQVPYRNLVFVSQNKGYFAELLVTISISNADSIVYSKEITDNIGVRNKHDVESQQKSYLNRISLLVDKPGYTVQFNATDRNSGQKFTWKINSDPLPRSAMISDIEMSQSVRVDTTQYMDKFKRSNKHYQVEPAALFSKEITDEFFIYFELYKIEASGNGKFSANLLVENAEDIEIESDLHLTPESASEGYTIKIPIEDLAPGIHHGTISVQYGELNEQRDFEFTVRENTGSLKFIFPDPQDELIIMKYFLSSGIVSSWSTMNIDAKRRYISQFWEVMARSANMTAEDMIEIVRERIQYTDRYFSHFEKGWKSDMGRIYIRNGAPDEIEKDQTSDDTRFVRKDFQIWKYTLRKNAVYVFIDVQMNGNFRLIYAKNDDMEVAINDLEKYLGTNFDTSRLNN